jgi:hypothetical protein
MSGVICIGIFLRATIPKAMIKKINAATAIGCLIESLIKPFIIHYPKF